jgi:cytochrome b561
MLAMEMVQVSIKLLLLVLLLAGGLIMYWSNFSLETMPMWSVRSTEVSGIAG